MQSTGFTSCDVLEANDDLLFDEFEGALPSAMFRFDGRTGHPVAYGHRSATTYGFVTQGCVDIVQGGRTWSAVGERYWFSVPGEFSLQGDGHAILFVRIGVVGEFHLAGPLSDRGRLAYLDGCSTSLLLPPLRKGDPVVNSLWFPEATEQTEHLHPTVRLAYVVSGEGICVTPSGDQVMRAGVAFRLDPMALHFFRTADSPLCVVTYHPDSDWGPTDEIHPVMNQTLTK